MPKNCLTTNFKNLLYTKKKKKRFGKVWQFNDFYHKAFKAK